MSGALLLAAVLAGAAHELEILQELAELLAIPNVASDRLWEGEAVP